jgi:iron(III) transport system substrate-binding protein
LNPLNTKKIKTFLAASALATALVVSLGACASETPAPVEEATSFTLYSGRAEELVDPLIELFTQETGIQVAVRYAGSAELAAQILEEGSNVQADAFLSQDAGALGALTEAGLFKTLDPSVTDLVDPAYRAADNTWVGVSGRSRVFSYNPAKVTAVPASVLDLTKPEWKGRIAIAPSNASFQSFVTALRVLEGEEVAAKWLAGMKTNAVLFEKNGQILDAVESGEVDAGLLNHYYWYEKAAEIGADKMTSKLGWFGAGDAGNLVNVAGVGLLSDNFAARSFAAWLLSETAQNYFTEKTFEYSLTGLPAFAGLPALGELASPKIDLSALAPLGATLEMIRSAGLTE